MARVKAGRPLINYLLKVCLLVGISPKDNLVIVIVQYAKFVSKMMNKSGVKYTSIYLKACYVVLQQGLAHGKLIDMTPLGARVSRNDRGIPRVIPASHRSAIRSGNYLFIRLWLSLFSLYRVLSLPYTLDLGSVTNPSNWDRSFTSEFSHFVPVFLRKLLDLTEDEWLWDCLNDRGSAMYIKVSFSFPERSTPVGLGMLSGAPASLIFSVKSWANSPLLPTLRDWLMTTKNAPFLRWLDRGIHLSRSWDLDFKSLSKFGFKEESAGKLRTFAIVDPITQWVMKGLHDKISELLRGIPQDGMFDQTKPLLLLLEKFPGAPLFCYDLKSATDRLPAILGATLLSGLVGAHLANLWLSLLTSREFRYSYKGDRGSVMYSVGQPMGAYTSWSLGLSLLHHALVQFCAHSVGHKDWFKAYALLGDDIVIADKAVAMSYLRLLERIDVKVGLAKSLVSTRGLALEFAKRFYYKGVDCSPISIKEMITCSSFVGAAELAIKYNIGLAAYLKLIGFGYKCLSSFNKKLYNMGSTLRLRVMHYKMFVAGLPPEYVADISDAQLAALLESEKISLRARLTSLQPAVALLKLLTTTDRTRAHYGTIEYGPSPLYKVFLDIPRELTADEKTWLHGTFEYIYRDYYIDAPIYWSRLNNLLEDSFELRDVTSLWHMLDELEALLMSVKTVVSKRSDSKVIDIPRRFAKFFNAYSAQFPHLRRK